MSTAEPMGRLRARISVVLAAVGLAGLLAVAGGGPAVAQTTVTAVSGRAVGGISTGLISITPAPVPATGGVGNCGNNPIQTPPPGSLVGLCSPQVVLPANGAEPPLTSAITPVELPAGCATAPTPTNPCLLALQLLRVQTEGVVGATPVSCNDVKQTILFIDPPTGFACSSAVVAALNVINQAVRADAIRTECISDVDPTTGAPRSRSLTRVVNGRVGTQDIPVLHQEQPFTVTVPGLLTLTINEIIEDPNNGPTHNGRTVNGLHLTLLGSTVPSPIPGGTPVVAAALDLILAQSRCDVDVLQVTTTIADTTTTTEVVDTTTTTVPEEKPPLTTTTRPLVTVPPQTLAKTGGDGRGQLVGIALVLTAIALRRPRLVPQARRRRT